MTRRLRGMNTFLIDINFNIKEVLFVTKVDR